MSSNSWKGKARRQQKETGVSYMRALREVDNDSGAGIGVVPESADTARMLSLLELDTTGTPDVRALWGKNDLPVGTDEPDDRGPLLRIPLGLQAGGSPVWLDLKARDTGGDGPHGLLVGTTGSGKSTALQAMAFALCAQHSPDQLQLVYIGAKDKSGFADFADYPQVRVIPSGTDYKATLLELIAARTEDLRAARAIGPDKATGGVEQQGAGLPAATVVVIDELTPQAYPDPDFAAALGALMSEGRSLGFHVLVASQVLSPVYSASIAQHVSARIALRTTTAEQSRDLIGNDDAYHLPMSAGLGLFCPSPGADPIPFRGFQVSRDLIRSVGRQLAAAPPDHG
jgi:S-DNA-T family DNA segregation ATPase FtsK/SpoIIIE